MKRNELNMSMEKVRQNICELRGVFRNVFAGKSESNVCYILYSIINLTEELEVENNCFPFGNCEHLNAVLQVLPMTSNNI